MKTYFFNKYISFTELKKLVNINFSDEKKSLLLNSNDFFFVSLIFI